MLKHLVKGTKKYITIFLKSKKKKMKQWQPQKKKKNERHNLAYKWLNMAAIEEKYTTHLSKRIIKPTVEEIKHNS